MMENPAEKHPSEFIEEVINSYENQIKNIESVFKSSEAVNDSSHHLFINLNQSIADLEAERMQLNDELRDKMARSGSLRKNDYDMLMDDIFQAMKKLEEDAKMSFTNYIEEQKSMVKLVRENIIAIKSLNGNSIKAVISGFKQELERIISAQQKGKEIVISSLIRFQNMHNIFIQHIQLLSKQERTKSKDIKELKSFILTNM